MDQVIKKTGQLTHIGHAVGFELAQANKSIVLKRCHLLVHERQTQFWFVGKAAIKGPLANAGCLGNVGHGDGIDAMFGKEVLGRGQDEPAVCGRVRPFVVGYCSIPIYYATGNRKKAFLYSFLSGLAEPVGAFIGYLLLATFFNEIVFGVLFAAVAGIMVFISLDELLPTAQEYGEHHIAVYGLVAGMAVMAASLLLFQ